MAPSIVQDNIQIIDPETQPDDVTSGTKGSQCIYEAKPCY